MSTGDQGGDWRDRLANGAFVGLIRLASWLPYARRIPAIGWVFAQVIAPLAGWRKRVRENLAYVLPELPPAEVARLVRAAPNNAGRAIAEIYSGAEFTSRVSASDPLTGPGLPTLREAAESGRPVVLACAHFGNFDATRAALAAQGWPVGGLYRPMNNAAFNHHYIPAITAIAQPVFPRSRAGLMAMLRFLRGGGLLCLGFDQHASEGVIIPFFGKPARTVLTPAELALKYDALLIPIAPIRQDDGLSFRIEVSLPIPPGTPVEMMTALNEWLEALIRSHMGQWFWVHRRWKNAER